MFRHWGCEPPGGSGAGGKGYAVLPEWKAGERLKEADIQHQSSQKRILACRYLFLKYKWLERGLFIIDRRKSEIICCNRSTKNHWGKQH